MNKLNITPEMVAQVLGSRRGIEREEQRFSMDDAYRLAVEVGKQMCPHFVIDDDNQSAYIAVAAWLVGDPNCHGIRPGKGIYLEGPVGCGKSLCLDIYRSVARYLYIQVNGEPIRWQTVRTEEVCDTFLATGNVDTFRDARVICFQDLGSEPTEVLYMGNRRNIMRSILEYRGDNAACLTLITSNIPADKAGEYYGQRVESRLRQMCNIITMGGSDRRKTL